MTGSIIIPPGLCGGGGGSACDLLAEPPSPPRKMLYIYILREGKVCLSPEAHQCRCFSLVSVVWSDQYISAFCQVLPIYTWPGCAAYQTLGCQSDNSTFLFRSLALLTSFRLFWLQEQNIRKTDPFRNSRAGDSNLRWWTDGDKIYSFRIGAKELLSSKHWFTVGGRCGLKFVAWRQDLQG